MTRKARQYLEYARWPASDKTLWQVAFAPGADIFDERGPGAHLAERSIRQLQYTYGKFLSFVTRKHPELIRRAAAQRINAKTVAEFVRSQPASCGDKTLSIYLHHLWLALRYLYPRDDWSWLLAISNRIKARAKEKPKRHHLVTSERLYELGLQLMDDAIASGKPPTGWRVQTAYRDGLIIALLALVPLRRRTLAALRIGKHLIKSGDAWVLDIPADDVKTRRPLEFPISPEISRRIDVHLNEVRPLIAGAKRHDYFWASARGRPMNGGVIYAAVRRRTCNALGFPVNLHRFRHAAATLWSVQDPANARGAKDLLGHELFEPTETFYIMGQSRLAGRALARAIDAVGIRESRR